MKTFRQRLEATMTGGNLRVADLARWFNVPYSTVRCWTQGVEPGGGPVDRMMARRCLELLERQIQKGEYLPLGRLSPGERIKALAALRLRVWRG